MRLESGQNQPIKNVESTDNSVRVINRETSNAPQHAADETGKSSKINELGNRDLQIKQTLTQSFGERKAPDLATQASVTPIGNKVVIDAGSGDDKIKVTQNAKTGDVTVEVNGAKRTFTGTDKDNLVIKAGDGNDTVTVGKGVTVKLRIEGGDGNDNITGGDGDDTIEAGAGNDTVNGGGGRDYVNGSTGDDKLNGGAGDDVIYGGDGNDAIQGNAGNDYLEGGKGNDNILGGAGADVLSGGIGDDALKGGDGDDVIYAGQGKDNVSGDKGKNSIYAQKDDTIQGNNAKKGISNTTVIVELTGNPGGLSVKVEGSSEFKERVEADLEMLRSSPTGRQMLAAFDKSYTETRSPLAGLPLIGGLMNQGTTVTIKETDQGNFESNKGTGRVSAEIGFNISRISLGGGGWRDRPPTVGLFHEMAHAYDAVNNTFQPGQYNGTDVGNHGVNNLERVAVGLPIDHDNDPTTPERLDSDHPSDLTENKLREEMRLPRRTEY